MGTKGSPKGPSNQNSSTPDSVAKNTATSQPFEDQQPEGQQTSLSETAQTVAREGMEATTGDTAPDGPDSSTPAPSSPATRETSHPSHKAGPGKIPVAYVAIGASAGGYDAIAAFLRDLPQTSMSYFVVQHHESKRLPVFTNLLTSVSKMPVVLAEHQVTILPDTVYVIPSHESFGIAGGRLMKDSAKPEHSYLPIDGFFRSLASFAGMKSIAMIFSGTGSDGTLGLAAIKEVGGLTFAQDESAKYDSMPKNAILSGNVDAVLSPEQIAQEMLRISQDPYLADDPDAEDGPLLHEDQLQQLFFLLKEETGVDFSKYKEATIKRRIYRRMLLTRESSIASFAERLQNRPDAIRALYNDLLINVTSFFRDPSSFDALKEHVFPAILKDRSPEVPIRIWVAGCSTGERGLFDRHHVTRISRRRHEPIYHSDLRDGCQ